MFGLHHFQKRRREDERGFPTRRSVAKVALDLLIYPAAIISPLAQLPQVYALFSSYDANGLALSTWVTWGLLNLLWITYGRVHREPPIVLTNSALFMLNVTMVVGILLYR